jgi:hypothetical protein
MAEDFPVVSLDDDARQAVELLASRRLPGLIVTRPDGTPYAVLPASQVVRFLVPSYVQDDPSLARVIDESLADRVADEPTEIPQVNHDDTILEIAAIMARLRCPLVVVVRDRKIVGAITASRLLELAMTPH